MFPQHLPGKANLNCPDMYLKDRTNWTLTRNVFRTVIWHWGPLELDLFATRISTQLVDGEQTRRPRQQAYLLSTASL